MLNFLQYTSQLDPSTLTIPLVYLLGSLFETVLSSQNFRSLPQALLPEGDLWPDITRTLLTFDPIQVRYVGPQFVKIIDTIYVGAEQTGNFVPAIQLLENAILRLDHASSTLTIAHYYFVKSCLYARAYNEATIVLNRPIYHIPTTDSTKPLEKRLSNRICSPNESSIAYINPQTGLCGSITSRVYLEYFLLSAMCFMGTENYKKAQEFLEVVLTAPTQQNVASLVQVEAYRKWLLLGLLLDGDSRELPKSMSNNAIKHIRAIGKPYECVVDAFKSNNMETLQAEVNEGVEVWTQDGNFGLMAEVVSAFRRYSVRRLSKTYAALPIEEVARLTSPVPNDTSETVNYVNMLIVTGALQAQLTPSPSTSTSQQSSQSSLGTLRFLSPIAKQKSETQVEQDLAIKTAELKILMNRIRDYDHQLEVNRDYIDWLQKTKKARDQERTKGDKNAASKPFGLPPAPQDLDEDMMDDWN